MVCFKNLLDNYKLIQYFCIRITEELQCFSILEMSALKLWIISKITTFLLVISLLHTLISITCLVSDMLRKHFLKLPFVATRLMLHYGLKIWNSLIWWMYLALVIFTNNLTYVTTNTWQWILVILCYRAFILLGIHLEAAVGSVKSNIFSLVVTPYLKTVLAELICRVVMMKSWSLV